MDVRTILVLTFETEDKKKVNLSLEDPRINLTEAEIKTAMELIVAKNIFIPAGLEIVSALSAKVVKTTTSGYDLVIA